MTVGINLTGHHASNGKKESQFIKGAMRIKSEKRFGHVDETGPRNSLGPRNLWALSATETDTPVSLLDPLSCSMSSVILFLNKASL